MWSQFCGWLQNLAEPHLHSKICLSSSCDACQVVSIRHEVFSDAEEEYPVANTSPEIKVEPENPTDSENVHGLCTEMCPASSHDAYQTISITAEVPSAAEEGKDPVPLTFVGIKAEPEVSCGFVSMLGGFHKYRYSLFYELLLQ
jgi:hypothetical protein